METASTTARRSHLHLVPTNTTNSPGLTAPGHAGETTRSGASAHPSMGRQPRPAIDDLDAELRLLEAVARRASAAGRSECRPLTVWARGTLADGRVLWAGGEGTWGVIEPVLAELLGWDASGPRPVRADVHSEAGRHEVLAVHVLRRIDTATDVA